MPKVQKNKHAACEAAETPRKKLPQIWELTRVWHWSRPSFDDGKGNSFYGKYGSCDFWGPETDEELTPENVKSIRKNGKIITYSRRLAQEKYNEYMLKNEHPPIFKLDKTDHR
jgi:hypothetical protein